MKAEEFRELSERNGSPRGICVLDLSDIGDRTLLYGYTRERDTWHVYAEGGEIHLHVYTHDGKTITHMNFGPTVRDAEDIIPDKRLYPSACDAEICAALIDRGHYLPFTTFGERPEQRFYGIVHSEIGDEI